MWCVIEYGSKLLLSQFWYYAFYIYEWWQMTSLLWFTFVMVVVDVLYSFVIVITAFVLNNFLFFTWHRLLFFFILNFIYSFRLSFFWMVKKNEPVLFKNVYVMIFFLSSLFLVYLFDKFFHFNTVSFLLLFVVYK